jgi:mediator of RNA polymerase II transcription subunit 5
VLVMTFVYRYHLTRYDIGIDAGTFVARMIATGQQSVPQADLTTDQSKHLGDWLIGLLNSGNEGLSNDVFASCRPQDFYLIVPTLFCQLVTVLSNDLVPFDTIKGALECQCTQEAYISYAMANSIADLGETVLLPSLIGGLSWMASHALLQTHNDLDALMQIFHVIILSEHSSGDAQAMHAAILAMVSSRLDKCFRTLRSRNADRGNKIEPMLQAIKEHRHYDRSMYASVKELEQWTNPPNSTLDHSLRNTVQQLTLWTSVGMQPNPPSYTHRQVYTSQNMLGAHKTLRALVSEIKIQTEAGNGAAALDIGVSIICAPTIEDSPMSVTWGGSTMLAPQPSRTRANLREMLKEDFDNAASLIATDPSTAETLVRLHRRVEAQLESATSTTLQGEVSTLMPDVNLAGMSSQAIPNEMHTAISEAAAASIANDITTMDNKALQRSMEELGTEGLDLSNIDMGTGDAGATGMGPELGDIDLSDIGGMNMDMDMDGLDMTMGGGGDDDWGLDFENM